MPDAPRGKTGPKGPNLDVSVEEIQKLAQLGCTEREMCCFLQVSRSTLLRRLQEPEYRLALDAGDGNLNVSLRRKQVELALAGNVTMLIWLGKQRLGQTDKVIHASTGADAITQSGTSAAEEIASRIAGIAERSAESTDPQRPN